MEQKIKIDPSKIEKWITTEIDNETIDFADKLGRVLTKPINKKGYEDEKEGLTNSQIRIFFGEMRRIQTNGYDEKGKLSFLMLKPKVAYASKGNDKEGMKIFYEFFCHAHKWVNNENTFDNFLKLMEAALAFHKFHGGKE